MKTNKNILNNTIALASLESSSIYKSSFMANAAILPFPTLFPPNASPALLLCSLFPYQLRKKSLGLGSQRLQRRLQIEVTFKLSNFARND